MIQHIKIDSPPVINSQILKNLGIVNILIGRNSSGKSTILKKILEQPDIGYLFKDSIENKDLLKKYFTTYERPTLLEVNEFIDKFAEMLDGRILFNSSRSEIKEIAKKAKDAVSFRYNIERDIERIAEGLSSSRIEKEMVLLLSPKRRLPYNTALSHVDQLDSEASVGLSRLFYLNNQVPDSRDKLIFEHISESFVEITGSEFSIQIMPDQGRNAIQLLFRRFGGSWIEAMNEGQGLSEILSILLYSLDGKYKLIFIEEPENHVHPDFQRKLLSFLNQIEDRQFILSTHSPVFLNPTMVDRIFFCKYIDGKILVNDNTPRAEALLNIGVLAADNLTSDAILTPVLHKFYS